MERPVIFLVDDDAFTLESLEFLLKDAYHTICFKNGADVLAHVKTQLADLILLDVHMPEIDGFEVCRRLKADERTRHIPVIFISALDETSEIMAGFTAGAVDYICKPFHKEEVLARVRIHLSIGQLQSQLQERNSRLQQEIAERRQAEETLKQYRLHLEELAHEQSRELRESEERFRKTFEQAAVGIAHVSPGGRFLKLNQRFCDIVGYTRDELLQRSFQDITYPDDLNVDLTHLQQVLDDTIKTYSLEKRYIHKNGSFVWINLTVSLVRSLSGKPLYFISVIEDISRRRQSDEALRISERQYRLLAQHVTDGVCIIQGDTVVFANQALADILETSPERLLGRSSMELFPEDDTLSNQAVDAEDSEQHWQSVQYTMATDERELWTERRHSTIQWEGKPALLLTIRDITRQKLREFAIKEERDELQQRIERFHGTLSERYRFGTIVGKSSAMQTVYELILKAAASDAPVIIYGESGTGKELVAQTIHLLSARQNTAFVPVNCGAVPEALFEREFFGHRKGSFTGAFEDQAGYFDVADRGTLFLDEIGDFPLLMQVKLLRALDGNGFTPVGSQKVKYVDTRIIAATNKNLPQLVQQGRMREDFFYRLNVITIQVPPLRERREDLPLLVDHFLELHGQTEEQISLPLSVMQALLRHQWPGNIRELQNVLQRYLTVGNLELNESRKESVDSISDIVFSDEKVGGASLKTAVDEFEARFIAKALELNQGRREKTAQMLGITRRSLHRKIQKYQLTPSYPNARHK